MGEHQCRADANRTRRAKLPSAQAPEKPNQNPILCWRAQNPKCAVRILEFAFCLECEFWIWIGLVSSLDFAAPAGPIGF